MRRNWMTRFQPVRRRAGVTANVISNKRSVQMPVVAVISAIGLAPRLFVSAFHPSIPNGSRQTAKAPTCRSDGFHAAFFIIASLLEVLLQIHAGIQTRHLVSVAVEQQRFAL